MLRKKLLYVIGGGIPRRYAFQYGHPREFPDKVDLYVFDYNALRIYLFPNWGSWSGKEPKPSEVKNIRTRFYPTDIYKKIAFVGEKDPGSLVALHFFSHGTPERGFTQGPWASEGESGFNRDFGSIDKGRFKAAFADNALVKFWGCGAQFGTRALTIRYCAIKNWDARKEIQIELEKRIRYMYARRLANLLNLTVWAAPPGWKTAIFPLKDSPSSKPYIDEWDPVSGPNKNSRWWRVDPSFLKGVGWRVYKNVLGAQIDPLGYVGITEQMSKAPPPPLPLALDPCEPTPTFPEL